jgi:hypothetical protein
LFFSRFFDHVDEFLSSPKLCSSSSSLFKNKYSKKSRGRKRGRTTKLLNAFRRGEARLLRFSFSLSLSLSEEQTKARLKVYENSLAFKKKREKKLSFSQKEQSCFPPSVVSVLFHFSLFTRK